ncbi:hypothetical protein N9195_02020 [bacterium]|nr:hypothetical protein [bacterium]
MSKLCALVLGIATLAATQAETVLWKATGTVDNLGGSFQGQDLSSGDPLELRMTYSDDAEPDLIAEIFGRVESDYRQNINLSLTVTSGNRTWQGAVTSADRGSPRTFFTKITNPFATAEFVEITATTLDQATFSSFPFRQDDEAAEISLSFLGANNEFLQGGISVLGFSISNLASATGTLSTGTGNELAFTLDPASLEILFENDEVIIPPVVSISTTVTPDSIALTWLTDIRFSYRVESTSDLEAETWSVVETRNGTDTPVTRFYPLDKETFFYRVVTVTR